MSNCMSKPDRLELELTSDPNVLSDVRQKLGTWISSQQWTDDQAAEIALAVDEAISNVIQHAYACETKHRILFSACTIHDADNGEGLEIRVRDFGRQVDPSQICGRALDDVRPGGLGVHIIRSMMNSAEYSQAEGGGMLLVMRKYKTHTVTGQANSGRKT